MHEQANTRKSDQESMGINESPWIADKRSGMGRLKQRHISRLRMDSKHESTSWAESGMVAARGTIRRRNEDCQHVSRNGHILPCCATVP
jgi:hypothetical protein